ncbi:MucR family transcriptional regulator [Kitasatospora sp. NPDC056076]|uniref:MucR family transcriptional regulator n=1 Tax=Kitasatospora sp. NPDC056076 TaxID=3345703 RepID=UPI0035DE9F13
MTRQRNDAHPDHGRLIRDEEADLVLCHLCGRGYRSLGSHLRAHGLTADEYRARFGLMRSRPLAARALSRARSSTQRTAFEASSRMRAHFEPGQAMARNGDLLREARRSFEEHGASAQLARERLEKLAAGRRTQSDAAAARLGERVAALGHRSLEQALRALYIDGDLSQEAAARALGVGNERFRDLLRLHGIVVRAVGRNSPTGKQARVASNDTETARRVGADDIVAWLREQRSGGATLSGLAARTGRSIPWVVARLRR